MKIILISLILFFFFSNHVFSQEDIGYKEDCCDFYYPGIVFENLLSIIDTTQKNILIEKGESKECTFKVRVMLDTITGYPNHIQIFDNCSILKEEQKISFQESLRRIQFDFCHCEADLKDLSVKSLYKQSDFEFCTGDFSTWWQLKQLFKDKQK